MTKTGRSIVRRPKGNECQCCVEGCGLYFSGETAFDRHFASPARGKPAVHVHPSEVGLVEYQRANGPTWGFPSDPEWKARFQK